MALSGVILSLAYVVGLLSTAIPEARYGLVVVGLAVALTIPRLWRTGPKRGVWLLAGVVALAASLYLQVRSPYPKLSDISQLVTSNNFSQEQVATVQGRIASSPRLTRSQRVQFWLKVNQVNDVVNEDDTNTGRAVTGKLYVTVPLLQGTGLHSGQAIAVTGFLYKPKPATNPGGFDFQAYLAQEGGFAGLQGNKVEVRSSVGGPWAIRQRIVQSQVGKLGSPEGLLVSSMVLGGRAVDLPYDVRDQFTQIGLAHALAASGFQTSLILGLVLTLTRRFSVRIQVSVGAIALFLFLSLTGVQPAVLRAVVMGMAVLVALAAGRKLKPLGSLLFAATLLLLFNPLWIWNLGFQLSFLATLGLLVTVPFLMKWLDWLPPVIGTAIAVPIAAYLWTLPLQLYAFGVVSPYSILVNIAVTPLIVIISVGGIISALVSLFLPVAGSTLAWLLYYPTHLLVGIVDFCQQLPGNSFAIGKITVPQLIVLYGLLGLASLQRWWRQRWWVASCAAICLVAIPVWYSYTHLFRLTVLATAKDPVLVLQNRGETTLINSGDENTANFTVLPFLQQQGINQIDWAIATNLETNQGVGWQKILERSPIKQFYSSDNSSEIIPASGSTTPVLREATLEAIKSRQGSYLPLPVAQPVEVGDTRVQLMSVQPPVIQFQVKDQQWLLCSHLQPAEQRALSTTKNLPQSQVLWWTGETLTEELLEAVQPEVAIASASSLDSETAKHLKEHQIQIYLTSQDGAIEWTPEQGFKALLDSSENRSSLL